MDFGIGFISTNLMLPILDFFHGIVPSYGFAIIALTLVIRFAVYPLSAGSIRSMRRTKISQGVMQKRVKEVQARHKDDPQELQKAMGEIYKEYGNPLGGCVPVLLQLPILWALFTTLRGSPFTNINYTVDVQILPKAEVAQVQRQFYSTKPQNIYIDEGLHEPIAATLATGKILAIGEKSQVKFQTSDGLALADLNASHPQHDLQPTWSVTKGSENAEVKPDGTIVALAPGNATIQGTVPGLAAEEGFLFINALGRVGATAPNGGIHWDIVIMVLFFGVSTYISQNLTGASKTPAADDNAKQQQAISKITPLLFTGMFLVFPLPAGVLMYMVVANIFQTAQTFILMKEPLPENLQKLVEQQEKEQNQQTKGEEALPFERKRSKKKEKPSG
jgi:YidC/Oxa1 family membrane protein insertase